MDLATKTDSGADTLDFDADAPQAKCWHWDTRVRPAGNDQFIQIKGDFRYYLDDPHGEPGFSCAPLNDQVGVLVIGGLMAAATRSASARPPTPGRWLTTTWCAIGGTSSERKRNEGASYEMTGRKVRVRQFNRELTGRQSRTR